MSYKLTAVKLILRKQTKVFNYFERIATTGSILAACDAGIIPASMPTVIQIIIVVMSMGTDMKTGKFNGPDNISVRI